MSEEENLNVEDQLHGDVQPTETEQVYDTDSTETESAQQSKRNDAEHNWAEMRRQMREKDEQLDDLRRQFTKFAERKPSPEEVDELANLAEDDILTVAQAKKLAQKIFKEREDSSADERLQTKFADYASVVNRDNLKRLYENEPELVENLQYIPDPYKKGVAAYKLLKKMEREVPNDNVVQKRQAESNSKKPVSSQAISKTSALADVNVFSQLDAKGKKDFLKSQWEDMQRSIKGF